MDIILSWSKKINLRILQKDDNTAGTWVPFIRQFNDSHSSCKQTDGARQCHQIAIGLSEILHCEGHYNGSVSTKISSHFLPQEFFLLSVWHSIAMSPTFQAFYVPHSWTSTWQKIRNLRWPDTISSHISSSSHNFGAGRHTAYNRVLCRSVPVDVRRGHCLTAGGVATTAAQLLAQDMVLMTAGEWWIVLIWMSIQGAVLRFRPEDIHFWIDPMPLLCAALKRALLSWNRLDSSQMLADRTQHFLQMAAAIGSNTRQWSVLCSVFVLRTLVLLLLGELIVTYH
jgi:hypothetical protein